MTKTANTEAIPVSITGQSGSIERPRHIFLTAAGDGSGLNNFNGNYATVSQDIYYQAVGDFLLYSMQISIVDAGLFAYSDYANNAALTNGIKFFFKPTGLPEVPLFNALTIKTNSDFQAMSNRYDITAWAGSAQTALVHIHAIEQYGCPLSLKAGDRLIIRLNDNFTGIISHIFSIGGKEVS